MSWSTAYWEGFIGAFARDAERVKEIAKEAYRQAKAAHDLAAALEGAAAHVTWQFLPRLATGPWEDFRVASPGIDTTCLVAVRDADGGLSYRVVHFTLQGPKPEPNWIAWAGIWPPKEQMGGEES